MTVEISILCPFPAFTHHSLPFILSHFCCFLPLPVTQLCIRPLPRSFLLSAWLLPAPLLSKAYFLPTASLNSTTGKNLALGASAPLPAVMAFTLRTATSSLYVQLFAALALSDQRLQTGSSAALSDLTEAAGWRISGCSPEWAEGPITIEIVCDGDDAQMAQCASLFEGDAVDTIVRLPEDVSFIARTS